MMKRILSILLASAMLLGIAGCNTPEPAAVDESTTEAATEEAVQTTAATTTTTAATTTTTTATTTTATQQATDPDDSGCPENMHKIYAVCGDTVCPKCGEALDYLVTQLFPFATTTTTKPATTTTKPATTTTKPATTTAVAHTEPEEPVETPIEEYGEMYGSARHIDGRTLIISIYSNDPTNYWDYTNDVDNETIDRTLYYLGIATDWISEQAGKYGADAEFIYDWKENRDLKYSATFTTELEKDDVTYTSTVYTRQKQYLRDNVDTDALLEKYDADNIIYMFFVDSDFSNTARTVTSPRAYLYGGDYYTEHINLCVRSGGDYFAAPSTYAHEILHCFGAYDLYYENQVITEEYVTYCAESGSHDIMYYINRGDKIKSEFTELDAYYIGITDYSKEVEEWDLGPSDYQ